MFRQIHFENLTLGMQAKVNTRYWINNNHAHTSNSIDFLRSFYPNKTKNSYLGDAIITLRSRLR